MPRDSIGGGYRLRIFIWIGDTNPLTNHYGGMEVTVYALKKDLDYFASLSIVLIEIIIFPDVGKYINPYFL